MVYNIKQSGRYIADNFESSDIDYPFPWLLFKNTKWGFGVVADPSRNYYDENIVNVEGQ